MPDFNMQIIKEWFSLYDDPFAPNEDPVRGVSFEKMPLTRELDIFTNDALLPYYIQTGSFKDAITQADAYLRRIDYPRGGGLPPAFFIVGDEGAGSSSLARYVAYLIKKHARQNARPGVKEVIISDANFGKCLLKIKRHISLHVAGRQECLDIINAYDKDIDRQDPDEGILEQLFTDLKDCMAGSDPLILIIHKLDFEQEKWPQRIHRNLRELNIVPIFLMDDSALAQLVAADINRNRIEGLMLRLDGLDYNVALDFLEKRLSLFRREVCLLPPGTPAPFDDNKVFPFLADELVQAFNPDNSIRVKFLIACFRDAIRSKLGELTYCHRDQSGNLHETSDQSDTPAPDSVLCYKDSNGQYQPITDLTAKQLLITWRNFAEGYTWRWGKK